MSADRCGDLESRRLQLIAEIGQHRQRLRSAADQAAGWIRLARFFIAGVRRAARRRQ